MDEELDKLYSQLGLLTSLGLQYNSLVNGFASLIKMHYDGKIYLSEDDIKRYIDYIVRDSNKNIELINFSINYFKDNKNE